MKCCICDKEALVQIIDWENNWTPYCWAHAEKELINPIPRDA